jgi:multidrug efflux pump subunit AcrB
MALTLWGKNYDSYRLRRIAGELENSLKKLNDVSETKIIGGQPRQIRVVLDTQRLAAYGLTPEPIVGNSRMRTAGAKPVVLRATIASFRWKRVFFHESR